MKKLNYSTYLMLPFLLVLLCGCDSEKFDYRNKYTGEFDVSGTMTHPSIGGSGHTAEISSIAIVDFAEEEKQIKIDVEGLGIHVVAVIDRTGGLSSVSGANTGAFTDKDHFDLSSSGWNPVGDQFEWDLHGERK